MRRRPKPRTLWISDDSHQKLNERGIEFEDAKFALEHRHLLAWQPSRERPPEEGSGMRPGRWIMIGRGLEEDIVTFVLEAPDAGGESEVVTGWVATTDEVDLYNQRT